MVARRGNAPRSAGCGPAAFLLSYRAMKKWHPHPVMLRGFLVENQACCYCTMRADETGGAPRTRTLDTIAGATVFKTASSTSRTRSVCEMAPPLGIAPSSHRLTGGPHTLCVERNCSRQESHLRRSA